MTRSARQRQRTDRDRLDPQARTGVTAQASAEDIDRAHREHRELVSFLESAPESVRGWARHEIAAADEALAALSHATSGRPARRLSARRPSSRRPSSRRPSYSLRRIAIGALALAVIAGVVVGVYEIGGTHSKTSSQEGGAGESQALTSAQQKHVSALMAELKSEPKDVEALIALGDVYFEAKNYNVAGGWMRRAVAADPGNMTAHMALGAAEFNIGDAADARTNWLDVVSADPKDVEAYYDLGFVYVSKEPPDMTDAKKVWEKVIALAPHSSEAKTVEMHIKGLTKG